MLKLSISSLNNFLFPLLTCISLGVYIFPTNCLKHKYKICTENSRNILLHDVQDVNLRAWLFETKQRPANRASSHPVRHTNASLFLLNPYSSSKGASCFITLNPLAVDRPWFPSDTLHWFPPFHETSYFSLKSQVLRSTWS